MKELLNHIKEKNFSKFYLFSGPEEYLKDYYTKQIVKSVVIDANDSFNYLKMFSDIDYNQLTNFVYSPPVFCDKKVLVIKNTEVFKKAKDSEKEIWQNIFAEASDDIIIIFSESEIDKRGVLYKKISSIGKCVSFERQKEADLKNWVRRIITSYEMKIDDKNIDFLISLCGDDMNSILNEIVKLVFFKKEDGVINQKDIELSVSKSIENRVFEMIDNATKGNVKKALEMFYDLKTLNEPPERILANISAEYLKLRKTKLICDKTDRSSIAKEIKVPPFFVSGYIDKVKKMSMKKINDMVILCQQTDYFIKNGIKEKWAAVENIIIQSQM